MTVGTVHQPIFDRPAPRSLADVSTSSWTRAGDRHRYPDAADADLVGCPSLSCSTRQSWRPITPSRFLVDPFTFKAGWLYRRYLYEMLSWPHWARGVAPDP